MDVVVLLLHVRLLYFYYNLFIMCSFFIPPGPLIGVDVMNVWIYVPRKCIEYLSDKEEYHLYKNIDGILISPSRRP